jgi:hypothetical protein
VGWEEEMMTQSEIVKRIADICGEFDQRLAFVSIMVTRMELAKALAEKEAEIAALKKEHVETVKFKDKVIWKLAYNGKEIFPDEIAEERIAAVENAVKKEEL